MRKAKRVLLPNASMNNLVELDIYISTENINKEIFPGVSFQYFMACEWSD